MQPTNPPATRVLKKEAPIPTGAVACGPQNSDYIFPITIPCAAAWSDFLLAAAECTTCFRVFLKIPNPDAGSGD
jgi:hypothetical protein